MQKKKKIVTCVLAVLAVVLSVILLAVGQNAETLALVGKAFGLSTKDGKTVILGALGLYGGIVAALIVVIVGLARKNKRYLVNAITCLGSGVSGIGMIDWRLARSAGNGKATPVLVLTFLVLILAVVGFILGIAFAFEKKPAALEAAKEETFTQEEHKAEEESTSAPEEEKPEEEPVHEEAAAKEPVSEEKAEEPAKEEPEEAAAQEKVEEPEEKEEEPKEETPLEEQKEDPAPEEPVKEEAPAEEAKPEEPKPEETSPAVEEQPADPKSKVVGKYEVYPVAGFFKFRLKANNGQILLVSRAYKTRDGALKGIETFRKNASVGSHRIVTDKKGRAQFRIFTANDARLVVAGEIYPNADGAQKALDSTLRFFDTDNVQNLDAIPESEIREWHAELREVEPKPNGKIEFFKDEDGKWIGDLRASNGELLFLTTTYSTKAALQNALKSVASNAMKGNVNIVCDKQNRYQFKVYSDNGMDLVFGETYDSKDAATSAASSARNFLHGQPKLVDLTQAEKEEKQD